MQLTSEQKRIVFSNNKINVVLSTPGSGKSTVVAARTHRIWNETKEPILICTFSNKAVKDLQEKIKIDSSTVELKTIHSLSFCLVKENWNILGEQLAYKNWPQELTLVNKDLELELYNKIPGTKRLNAMDFYNDLVKFRELNLDCTTFINLNTKGLLSTNFHKDFSNILPDYEYARFEQGLITYDDMLYLANEVLKNPEVHRKFCNKYYHIMLDEAQDTSQIQWDIIKPLVNSSISTLCVGDLNQSLYGWRGANGAVFSKLSNHKDAELFRLTQSFRTSQEVTLLANKVVVDSSSQIVSKREAAGKIRVIKFNSVEEEAFEICKRLDSSTAVLARTNYYLEPFERYLLDNNISFIGTSFYASEKVKDIVSFSRELSGKEDVLPILKKVYLNSKIYSEEELDKYKAILFRIKSIGFEAFLNYHHKSINRPLEDGPTLLTGHGSKGLEWEKVYLVGANSKLLPHRLSTDEKEERNLFYVMVSRAKDELYISYTDEPSKFIPQEYFKNGN